MAWKIQDNNLGYVTTHFVPWSIMATAIYFSFLCGLVGNWIQIMQMKEIDLHVNLNRENVASFTG